MSAARFSGTACSVIAGCPARSAACSMASSLRCTRLFGAPVCLDQVFPPGSDLSLHQGRGAPAQPANDLDPAIGGLGSEALLHGHLSAVATIGSMAGSRSKKEGP